MPTLSTIAWWHNHHEMCKDREIVVQAIFRFYLAGAIACILWLGNMVHIAEEQQLFDWQRARVGDHG